MGKWKIYTPEGVQDFLYKECFIKRQLESKLREYFGLCGFMEIETPTYEFYDVFALGMDLIPQETMFKFFDQKGRILVLRPEITIPVARITATKFREADYPLKFSYIGNSYMYNESGGGKQKEFTQAGIEIMGNKTAEADAEVIAMAIQAVKACGLSDFQIDIGQVDFFKGLMEETKLSADHVEQMRNLIDKKDFLGIEELVNTHNIRPDLKELILNLPGLFGSVDVIDKIKQININKRSLNALENLRKVLEILDDYGLSKYVSLDLGMVQSLNYYTGMIFRGFTYGVGFPILSGGRYDNLVERFGKSCPAVGFSLGINMIMMALDRQKIAMEKPVIETLICYTESGRKTAFSICNELRRQGISVEIDILTTNINKLRKYAKNKGIGGIISILDTDNIEVLDIESNKTSKVTVNELLNK